MSPRGTVGGYLTNISLSGEVRPAEPNEAGRKDTVIAYPGEVTRILVTFARRGEYVWHCHILSHEDHEMMRRFIVA
jgi:spore coat protein A